MYVVVAWRELLEAKRSVKSKVGSGDVTHEGSRGVAASGSPTTRRCERVQGSYIVMLGTGVHDLVSMICVADGEVWRGWDKEKERCDIPCHGAKPIKAATKPAAAGGQSRVVDKQAVATET